MLAEYIEVETGKCADRPRLIEALAHARKARATLVIAKLDQLCRRFAATGGILIFRKNRAALSCPCNTRWLGHVLLCAAIPPSISSLPGQPGVLSRTS